MPPSVVYPAVLESGWYPELWWELQSLSLEPERSLWREGKSVSHGRIQTGSQENDCHCWEGRWTAQPFARSYHGPNQSVSPSTSATGQDCFPGEGIWGSLTRRVMRQKIQ